MADHASGSIRLFPSEISLPDWAFLSGDRLVRFISDAAVRDALRQFGPIGAATGVLLAWWSAALIARMSSGARRLNVPGALAIVLAPAVLFPSLALAVHQGQAHWLTEAGSFDYRHWRMAFHFVLLSLLIVATAVDFDQYLIPDEITLPGTVLGVMWCTAVGNMQLVPVWIDWNRVHLIHGPYIPEWLSQHPHLHGLAFSVAGMVAGAGLTWVTRRVAQAVLRVEALGGGDVTLMAMIGAFLGWQPMVFVFLFAPVGAVVIGVLSKVVHARRAIPYGPYLSAAAVVVLFTWRWLWVPTREVFGHWPTLAALAAFVAIGIAIQLGMLRLYRSIPVTRRTESAPKAGERVEMLGENSAILEPPGAEAEPQPIECPRDQDAEPGPDAACSSGGPQ